MDSPVAGSDALAAPAGGAEGIAAGAEFGGAGGGAFENIRHDADAAGVFGGDLGDVLAQGLEFAEDGDGAAGAAAGDLGAVEALGGAARANGFDEEVDLFHREAAVIAVALVGAVH